jgi:tripartite-type tricarboxylate transporter receptor subunit TctC
MPDLMSGQVAILFDSVLTAKPHLDAKRLVGLAVSSRERSPLVPEMPTVAESGLPGFDSWTWFGVFGPAGTPQPVIDRLNAEMNRIISDAAIKERFTQLGFETTGGTPADFSSVVQGEARKWSKVIREANVKPE